MEDMDIGILLEDFRSIKLPKGRRAFVDGARDSLRLNGSISAGTRSKLRKIASLYRRQFFELYAARDRARRTLWKHREGITDDRANELVKERREKVAAQKSDLGI